MSAQADPVSISPEDLSELRVVHGAYNDLLLALAKHIRQARAMQDQLHSKIDNYERQMALTFGRMQQKYGLEQNASINLETGAVE
jgi:hypothetical protein